MRASRLVSILFLLQLRPLLTAESLAEEFEVSVRTIYRDIDSLLAAGAPIIADRGPGGGFRLEDGWRARLSGIASEEAEAMTLIGLPGPAETLGLGRAATAARKKLLAALPADWSAAAGRVGARFHFDPVEWYRAPEPAVAGPALARAVLDERVVEMSYESWSGRRRWRVEPLGLVQKAGAWYLVAVATGKTRVFKLSNIADLAATNHGFQRPLGFDLARFWSDSMKRFERELRPLSARLRVSSEGARRVARLGAWAAKAVAEAPPFPGDMREITLAIESVEDAARLVLGLGPGVEALSPPGLRSAIVALAGEAAQRHGAGARKPHTFSRKTR